MKELTIEQKAKAYDNAIEIINDYYQKTRYSSLSCASNAIEVLEKAFPELKEGEGDMVRKEIIDFATKANNGITSVLANNYNFNKWIAWLEKQGEQKPAWSEEDEKKRTLLISILKVNHPNGYFKVNPANTLNMEAMHTEELVNWLKFLKDRYTWKPSDEQMVALSTINVTGSISYAGQGQELINLYNDLKKLKGK